MDRPQPHRKGEIHLGELIEALAELPWQEHAQAQAIAGCLGFGLAAHDLGRSERPTPAIYDRSRPVPLPRREAAAKPRSGFATRPPPRLELPPQALTWQLQPITPPPPPSSTAAAPSWIDGDYQRLDPAPGTPPPPRQTLFPGRTARGVFTAALATLRLGREIDVHGLVGSVVRGHLPRRLPRLPAATLSRGCQLLLDFSDSMLPWWADLRQLGDQLAALLGDERVSVFDFESAPAAASQWQAGREEAMLWQPEAGRPILVATDFGIRGRSHGQRSSVDWQDFVRLCAAQGCPLLILVPWSKAYWPADLGPHPELLHWHPRTSAAMLRRQLARSQPTRR
ncbi:MAG: hypothetical protein IPK02_06280 [Candidatus Accumulibacter sp.]|uniref:Uncharacterized protein n=1 Tax=Candidatus Accumulibacter affinis TaxID=2954384 RepID=A0A935T8E3_9PROT|nr:hypothetical protein [Candidatus Accumulibacter affinis]